MIKPSKVKFISENLQKNFNSLGEDDPIKKAIKRAIKDLQNNAFSGIQIPKRLIPKGYILKYNVKKPLEIWSATSMETYLYRHCWERSSINLCNTGMV